VSLRDVEAGSRAHWYVRGAPDEIMSCCGAAIMGAPPAS
jgi:hypothetical protein